MSERAASHLFTAGGDVPAMTTFRRPLALAEYEALVDSGVLGDVTTFEAIGEFPDGTVATVGGPADAVGDAPGLLRADGALFLGVVAVSTILGEREEYRGGQADHEVLLVDLSGAAFVARLNATESCRR